MPFGVCPRVGLASGVIASGSHFSWLCSLTADDSFPLVGEGEFWQALRNPKDKAPLFGLT